MKRKFEILVEVDVTDECDIDEVMECIEWEVNAETFDTSTDEGVVIDVISIREFSGRVL